MSGDGLVRTNARGSEGEKSRLRPGTGGITSMETGSVKDGSELDCWVFFRGSFDA